MSTRPSSASSARGSCGRSHVLAAALTGKGDLMHPAFLFRDYREPTGCQAALALRVRR